MKLSSKDLKSKLGQLKENKQLNQLTDHAKTQYLKSAQEDAGNALWFNAGKEAINTTAIAVGLSFIGVPPIVSIPLLGAHSACKQRASLRVGQSQNINK